MSRKDFKKHNTGFVCQVCKAQNEPASHSERNHCRVCLRSLHVDGETPGDRAGDCGGVMEPIRLEYSGEKGYMIVHRCENCGKEHRNKTQEDDENIQRLA